MARRLRVPGLLDRTIVDDPAEVRVLVDEPALDRHFVRRGPLFSRIVAGRIRRWFSIDGALLPALSPRSDAVRAQNQRELAQRLSTAADKPLWTEAQRDRLAVFVRGNLDRAAMGVAVQEVVGRLFHADYLADQASWEAAELIDQFRDSSVRQLPRDLLWMVTGRLTRARDLLIERARHDRVAMHGTAIGLHGIVAALQRMRRIRAEPGAHGYGKDTVLGRCLHPPKRVPRMVEAALNTPVVPGRLRAGGIVMLQLEEAGARAPGAEMTFMHGHWNACPAEIFVPALLWAVWLKSI